MKIPFNKKYLKKITDYSVVLVPHDPSLSTKTLKLSLPKIAILFVIYSLVVFFAGFYLITASSFGRYIIPDSFFQNSEEQLQLKMLNEKIIQLADEIQKLKSSNQRLKNILSQQDSLNPDVKNLDEKKNDVNKKSGGNIFAIFKSLIEKHFFKQSSVIFIKPAEGYISRKFDPENGHYGIDFATNENNPIFASAGGYISFAGYTPEYGYTMIINHSDDYITRYMHCAILIKKQGEKVQQGELIALAGNTGTRTTGTHLHFEIWFRGKPVNPEKYILNF